MLSIIYMSRASRPFSGKELVDLLDKARANNRRNQLTGLLLYKEGAFMQVLEGHDDVVRGKMAEIRQDPRHLDVTVLAEEPMEVRRFPHYAMGFVHIDAVLPERRKLVERLVAEPLFSDRYRRNPQLAWDLLLSFKGTFK